MLTLNVRVMDKDTGFCHAVLNPGQTIARCQLNISQHFWAQHVACVWPPCCDEVRHVGCRWLKFDHLYTRAYNTQHVATLFTGWRNARNMLRPTMLRYVGVILRSFGRGFRLGGFLYISLCCNLAVNIAYGSRSFLS